SPVDTVKPRLEADGRHAWLGAGRPCWTPITTNATLAAHGRCYTPKLARRVRRHLLGPLAEPSDPYLTALLGDGALVAYAVRRQTCRCRTPQRGDQRFVGERRPVHTLVASLQCHTGTAHVNDPTRRRSS